MQTISRKLNFLPLLFLLPLLFTFQACKNKEVVRAKEIPEAVKSYVYAYTAGVISKNEPVRVRFASAVAGEDLVGKEADSGILSFSPSTSGTAYWEDDHTVRFEPKNSWKSGVAYIGKVDLSEVFDNLPNEAKGFEFDFLVRGQGLSLEVTSLQAFDNSDLSKQSLMGQIFTNDEADPKGVEGILTARQGGKKLPISWVHNEEGTNHEFTVSDIQRGSEASQVTLAWDGSDIGVEVEDQMTINIPALGDFSVTTAKVVDGDNQYIEFQFSDPLDPAQNLNGLIAVRAGENSGESEGFGFYNENIGLNFSIDGNRVLAYPQQRLAGVRTLEVRPGVRNAEGAAMSKPSVWQLDFEQEKPHVRLVGRGVILPAADKGLVLPFEAVGLEAVEVEVFKIYDNNILQFLQTSDLDATNNYEMQRVGRVIRRQMVPLQGLNPGANAAKWSRYALDLNKLFAADPNAIYQVRIGFRPEYALYHCSNRKPGNNLKQVNNQTNLDEEGEIRSFWGDYYGMDGYYEGFRWQHRDNPCFPAYYNSENFTATNVMASNLGITAKSGTSDNNREYSLFVAVADLRTAEEIDNATLEFYDYQQQLISTTTTNGDGIAEVVLPKKPFLIIAKTEKDRGYLKTGDGNSLSLSRFDVAGTEKQKGLKGFLYGDRGVWRPGDSLFLNFILEDKEAKLPDNYPISFELTDSRGQVQYRTVTTKNVENLYPLPVATSAEAPTGNWLAVVKAGGATFTKNLKIETVKPNRLKIDLNFPSLSGGKDQLSANDEPYNVNMQVNWLHGAAGKDLKAVVEAEMRQSNMTFKNYKDYEFDDPARFIYSEPSIIFDGKTDGNGKASFTANLYNKSIPSPGMLQANFRARAFEKGGDFSFYNTSLAYSPYNSYSGLLISKNQYGEKRMDIGKDGKIKFAAVDEKGNPLKDKNLSVGLYRVEWRWWWDSDDGGVSQYNSSNHFNAMQSESVRTASDGTATWNVNVNTWGRYLVRVCDTESGHCSGDYFYAGFPWYGDEGNSIAQRQEAAMMTFSASKEKYKVSDNIELTIPAGDEGRVLVTLESGSRVIRSFWDDVEKGENKIKFKATADMSPTVYAHVSLIQPHGQTKNDLPIRMYGVLAVDVEDPETVLKPAIKLPAELKPEQEFTIEVSEENNEPMAYTIAVVDEGLLGLTNFKTPDPHAALYAREALGVKTWDVYDYVLGAYGGELERILSIGGDDELTAPAERKNANRFRAVVLNAGPFYMDGGKKKHTFKMPNYVGSVRVMLVAANKDAAYGKTEKVVPVKKPLMALATLPRMLGIGETLRLPVSVFAMDKKVQNVDVQLVETTGLVTINGGQTKQLRFNEPGEDMAYFNLTVGNAIGIAKFKITASGANEKSTQNIEIDVRNPNPYVTNVFAGSLQPGGNWQQVVAPVGSPGTNTGFLEVSSIPPLKLGERLNYLIRYPHGCIEQTTSSGFPQLYVEKMMELTKDQKEMVKQNVSATIDKLKNFQMVSGGFTYWPGNDYDSWGTNYAGHFLLEAKDAGYVVPQNMLDRFVKFQATTAKQWNPGTRGTGGNSWTEIDQAYRLYTLALAGKPEQGSMNRLRELPNLSNEAKWRLAAAYALSGKKEVGQQLVNALPVNVPPYSDWGNTYGSSLRDEAMILEAQVLLGDTENAAANLFHIAEKLGEDYWYSTQTTAYSLLAIGKFLGKNKATDEFKFQYQLPNGQVVNAGSKTPVMQIEVPVEQAGNRALSVANSGNGVLFARLILTGQPLTGKETAASNNLNIRVAYRTNDGQPINPNKIAQGTDFIAEVTINHPGTRAIDFDEMALTQIFPSGWEILNARLYNFDEFSNTSVPEYQDIRDDRVFTYFDIRRGQSQVYRVRLNAAYPGRYYLPAVSCSAMYDESINARVPGEWVEVISEVEM